MIGEDGAFCGREAGLWISELATLDGKEREGIVGGFSGVDVERSGRGTLELEVELGGETGEEDKAFFGVLGESGTDEGNRETDDGDAGLTTLRGWVPFVEGGEPGEREGIGRFTGTGRVEVTGREAEDGEDGATREDGEALFFSATEEVSLLRNLFFSSIFFSKFSLKFSRYSLSFSLSFSFSLSVWGAGGRSLSRRSSLPDSIRSTVWRRDLCKRGSQFRITPEQEG